MEKGPFRIVHSRQCGKFRVKVLKLPWKSRGFSVWQRVLGKRDVIFSGKQCTKVVEAKVVYSAWDIQRLWEINDIS